jgi:hypothetical protein
MDVLGREIISFPLPKKIKPWFHCHFAHNSVSYSTELSHLPFMLPNTQHSKHVLCESRKLPLFNEQEGSFSVHQHYSWSLPYVRIIHSTSHLPNRSLTINFTDLSTFKHLWTLPCMLPTFPITDDFISLTLLGKQSTLLCHQLIIRWPRTLTSQEMHKECSISDMFAVLGSSFYN